MIRTQILADHLRKSEIATHRYAVSYSHLSYFIRCSFRLVDLQYERIDEHGQKKIWDDSGSGADKEGSFWRIDPSNGYYPLGDAACRGWEACKMLIRVKDVSSEQNILRKEGFQNKVLYRTLTAILLHYNSDRFF